jgi:hypothetical protein
VERYGCDIEEYRGVFAKQLRKDFDQQRGPILAIDPLMDGSHGRGPAVDHGSRVHGAQAKGVRPDLIWTVHRRSGSEGGV